jgi:hypothetical protein
LSTVEQATDNAKATRACAFSAASSQSKELAVALAHPGHQRQITQVAHVAAANADPEGQKRPNLT